MNKFMYKSRSSACESSRNGSRCPSQGNRLFDTTKRCTWLVSRYRLQNHCRLIISFVRRHTQPQPHTWQDDSIFWWKMSIKITGVSATVRLQLLTHTQVKWRRWINSANDRTRQRHSHSIFKGNPEMDRRSVLIDFDLWFDNSHRQQSQPKNERKIHLFFAA